MTASSNEAPLRVLHVLPSLIHGGAETVCADLAIGCRGPDLGTTIAISRTASEVERVVRRRWGSEAAQRVTTDLPLEARLRSEGVPLVYLHKRTPIDAAFSLLRTVRRLRPDVVHTHLHSIVFAAPVTRFLGIPHCHTVHTTALEEAGSAARVRMRRRAFRRVHPISISEAVAKSVHDVYGLQSPVIRNAVALDRFDTTQSAGAEWREREGIPADAVVVLAVGRLRAVKNPTGILGAFQSVAKDHPNAHLIFIGDGDLEERLADQRRTFGLAKRVHFLGTRTDVPEALAAADIFVQNSLYEGLGIAAVEAMASGLPVIATAVGGLVEVVSDDETGTLIPSRSQAALADALTAYITDPALRARHGSAGRVRARSRHGLTEATDGYIRVYKALAERRPLIE
ncbi:MAG: glycosyltransferase [Proteobacteria bacterium]|nr:glycosyltransferase [Pseudomonadota bacterium]